MSRSPRAVSMIGIRSIERSASPRSRSTCSNTQSIVASVAGLSTFGRMTPSSPGCTTATRSPQQNSVSAALTRTYSRPVRDLLSATAMAARVAGFSAVATASSRSRITASASSVSAFSTRRAWLPGANRKLRRRGWMGGLLSKSPGMEVLHRLNRRPLMLWQFANPLRRE